MVVYFVDDYGNAEVFVDENARDIAEVVYGTPNPSDSYMLIPFPYADA